MKIFLTGLFTSLGCFVCRPTAKDITVTAQLQQPVTCYMVLYTPGPQWLTGLPAYQQPGITDHVQYIDSIAGKQGKTMGGSFADGKSSASLWFGKTKMQVQQIVDSDPSIRSGLQQAEIKEWIIGITNIKEINSAN